MIPTIRNKTSLFIIVFPALLAIVGLYILGGISLFHKPSNLITPAELRAREAHRANWVSIPITGAEKAGMSQQAIDAYATRMEGLAAAYQANNSAAVQNLRWSERSSQPPISNLQRAHAAYAARLTGLAGTLASQQRANQAYAARWQGLADYTLKHAGK